jgi:hypothetical protein
MRRGRRRRRRNLYSIFENSSTITHGPYYLDKALSPY